MQDVHGVIVQKKDKIFPKNRMKKEVRPHFVGTDSWPRGGGANSYKALNANCGKRKTIKD